MLKSCGLRVGVKALYNTIKTMILFKRPVTAWRRWYVIMTSIGKNIGISRFSILTLRFVSLLWGFDLQSGNQIKVAETWSPNFKILCPLKQNCLRFLFLVMWTSHLQNNVSGMYMFLVAKWICRKSLSIKN